MEVKWKPGIRPFGPTPRLRRLDDVQGIADSMVL